jgi:hypothetical protein
MSDLLNQASLVMVPSGYKEDTVYSVVPSDGSGDLSFTRASNGTRINSAGLVEVCPWNFNTESENFTLNWGTDGTSTATNNFATAPNGTTTAAKVVVNSVNGYAYKNVNVAPNTYTVSYYIKASTNSTGGIGINDIGGAGYSSTSINITTEWQRFEHTFNVTLGTSLYIDYGFASTSVNYFIWGAQLNIGSTAKPYFPTTDRLNVPRLTYQNGGGGCPSLLLEKQSTNLALYSEQFDNAAWSKINTTVTANTATSPDGTQNADTIDDSSSSFGNVSQLFVSLTNATYTFSVFVKAVSTATNVRLDLYTTVGDQFFVVFNSATGAYVTGNGGVYTSTAFNNGWFRFTLTATGSGNTNVNVYPNAQSAASTGAVYLWGAQLEASSYSTSYIQTTSSSATRVADACYKTGISSLIGQTSGTIFWDINFVADGSEQTITINDGTNFIYLQKYIDNKIYTGVYNGSFVGSITSSVLTSGRKKIAFGYILNSLILYINGVSIGTDLTSTIPTCDRLSLTVSNTGSIETNNFILFPTKLTNSELASLTTL